MVAVFPDSKVAKHSFDSVEHVESSVSAIAPPPEFRRGYGEDAVLVGDAVNVKSELSTSQILEVAFRIQEQKKRLNRKEFGSFVQNILEWTHDTTRKYLNVAKTYAAFPDLSVLSGIEPFMLLRLCSKKYAKVVEKLKEETNVSLVRIAELIKDLVAKPEKKTYKQQIDPVSGWRQDPSGGGRHYQLPPMYNEAAATKVEQLAQDRGVMPLTVVEEAITAYGEPRPMSEYHQAQIEELQAVVEDARQQRAAAAKANLDLRHEKERASALEQKVAELNAILEQQRSKTTDAQGFGVSAHPNGGDAVQDQVFVQSNGNTDLDEGTLQLEPEPEQLIEMLETEPVEHNFSSWPEFADTVRSDLKTLMSEVRNWSTAERQVLSTLLAEHLESLQLLAFDDVAWVPEKLLHSALSKLSFTITKIGGPSNLVDEPEIEHINGCRFVSLKHLGIKRREQWVFESCDGRTFCVFGRDEFSIEHLAAFPNIQS